MKVFSMKYLFMGLIMTPIITSIINVFNDNIVLFIIVGVFVIVDTILGIRVAYIKKEAKSSTFFDKFFNKFMAYSVLVIISFAIFLLVQTTEAYNIDIKLANNIIVFPMSVMIARELWSLGEGINVLQPGLWDAVKGFFGKIVKDGGKEDIGK